MQETCGICGKDVPFSLTAHVLIHPNTDEGVVDYYVCRHCFDDRVAPLFDGSTAADQPGADGEAADLE